MRLALCLLFFMWFSSVCLRPTQERLQGHGKAYGGQQLARTVSLEESARSSASLGTGLANDWRARLLGDSEDDGDSPASLLRYSLPLSERPCPPQPAVFTTALAGAAA